MTSETTLAISSNKTIAKYLLDRLYDMGVRHVFGIPGDYVLRFFKMLEDSPIEVIVTTNELCAGYAADAYARVHGIGCTAVTYAVGGFSLTNALACAYAEKSPLICISGAPGIREVKRNWLLHHMVGDASTQLKVFEPLTVASAVLNDPLTAFREIDRVLGACIRHQRPVYLELPRDRLDSTYPYPHILLNEPPVSDERELQEAVWEAVDMLRRSKSPVIIAGVELHRFKLTPLVLKLAEKYQIPIVSTLLSKSVIPEKHPLFAGVYQAAMGRPIVTRFVEDSDCILMFGAMITDTDTGIFTHKIDENHVIFATSEEIRIRYHKYQDILVKDFLEKLNGSEMPVFSRTIPKDSNPINDPWTAKPETPITVSRLLQKVNSILEDNHVIVADPGDAMFASAELNVHSTAEFLGSAFYATLGWAVPAAIGAQIAAPNTRPIVMVGDGAFQMTGTELGTTRRKGLNPIVILINNEGYLIEKFILEGKFNDIPNWNYHKMPDLLGDGIGFEVKTEEELDAALEKALANQNSFSILNVRVASDDCSPALKRLGEGLANRVAGK
jgi:indolepyruvate decarboxylase